MNTSRPFNEQFVPINVKQTDMQISTQKTKNIRDEIEN